MSSESKIQKKLRDCLKPKGFLVKISDRFTSGIPDYVFTSNGITCFIETKAPNEELRPIQLHFKNQIEKNGGIHYTVKDMSHIQKILTDTKNN